MRASLFIGLLLFAADLSAQVSFELKYPEDRKSVARINSKTHQLLTIGGQEIETKSNSSMLIASTNGKRQPDKSMRVIGKISEWQVDINLPGGIKLSFDAANPDRKAENPALEPILTLFRAQLRNAPVLILDKENKIASLEYPADPEKELDPALKGTFNAKRAKIAAQQTLDRLPSKPVNKGDKWEREETFNLEAGQSLTLAKRYEYIGTVVKAGRTLHEISAVSTSVKYEIDPESPSPIKVSKSDLKVIDSKETILFDTEKGIVAGHVSTLRVKGDLALSVNGMDLAGTVDLTLSTETTVE